MTTRDFPQAQPHGELEQVFDGIHVVTGSVTLGSVLPMRFSRNMTVIAEDGALTLVNTVRLNEGGLAALEALGEVRHLLRIAGFHGMDDPFYKDRYGATVWSIDAPYLAGFSGKGTPYLTPDKVIGPGDPLPVSNARLLTIASASPVEGLLMLDRDGGIIVAGDCLQNFAVADGLFNLPARLVMRMMGFIKPCNIGPGWLKAAKPDVAEVKALLNEDFAHVLPAHGTPVIGDAKARYRPVIEAL